MSYRYLLHEAAQKDYEVSLEWYRDRSVQAAENFIKAADRALQLICDHPHQWRNAYRNYHELSLKRYPFTFIYTIEEKEGLVNIHCLYHHKRNPKKKYPKA